MIKQLILIFTTFFYLGYFPVAPGTVGTFGGVLLYFILYFLKVGWVVYGFIFLGLGFLGVIASSRAENYFSEKDPSQIVIDEVVGFLITMFMIPFSWPILLIGFVLNRVLDIWKPFPARQSQQLPGGWGIMVDDFISGFYSNLLLWGMLYLVNFFVKI
jgi:phosphatidylglycerophosphatase A